LTTVGKKKGTGRSGSYEKMETKTQTYVDGGKVIRRKANEYKLTSEGGGSNRAGKGFKRHGEENMEKKEGLSRGDQRSAGRKHRVRDECNVEVGGKGGNRGSTFELKALPGGPRGKLSKGE